VSDLFEAVKGQPEEKTEEAPLETETEKETAPTIIENNDFVPPTALP